MTVDGKIAGPPPDPAVTVFVDISTACVGAGSGVCAVASTPAGSISPTVSIGGGGGVTTTPTEPPACTSFGNIISSCSELLGGFQTVDDSQIASCIW